MTDIDRYMTEEVVDKAARAEWEYEWADRSWEVTPDEFREFYIGVARASLSAVLPEIIQKAKSDAWDEALHGREGWMQDQRYYEF